MSNEELLSLLRSVIQEELKPVKEELQAARVQMNSRFDTLETKLSIVEKDLSAVKQDVTDIKAAVSRIEENEPADVIGLLKQINDKLDAQQDVANKVSDQETDIKLIKKLLTNQ